MSQPVPRRPVQRDATTGMPLRKITLMVPDARDPEVLARAKKAVAELNAEDEADAIAFIEAVSDYEAEGLLLSE